MPDRRAWASTNRVPSRPVPRPWIGFDVKIRQAPVRGGFGPVIDAGEFLDLRRGEQAIGLLHGAGEAPGAEVVLPAFEHRVFESNGQDLGEHGQVFANELLLQVDSVGRDDGLLFLGHGEQDGRDEIRQAFADAGAGLDNQMALAFEGAGGGHGHLLLLRPVLEVARLGQETAW